MTRVRAPEVIGVPLSVATEMVNVSLTLISGEELVADSEVVVPVNSEPLDGQAVARLPRLREPRPVASS